MQGEPISAWYGPPGSESVIGPGSNQVPAHDGLGLGVVQVFEPREEAVIGCQGKLSDNTRCRKGKKPLCREHLHLKK
jgi:hypothetical protein